MMKKIILSSIAVMNLCYSNFVFSNPQPNWTGFYVGGHAGYWQSATDKISVTGSANYFNQEDAIGASNIANALAQIATNNASFNSHGFIGGGLIGYNYESSNGILLGLNIDFDGVTNSKNTASLQKNVNLVDFDESYSGSVTVKQDINYLSTLRARLGYLFYPSFLVYATGGLAYANVTLDTSWTAQESLGSTVFPTVAAQNNVSKTLSGWTAGAGVEWLFKPHWSAMLEYNYYSLNNLKSQTTLTQMNASTSPPVLWGSALASTALSLSVNTVRVGVNYHFS